MSGIYPIFSKISKLLRQKYFVLSNVFIIVFLLLLPYLLFEGKFFVGGDDTRLFYIYPKEYLINIPFFSWTNLSSIGWNFSYQSFLPFVSLWTVLEEIVKSKIILSYFSFSLSFILGLVFFQRLTGELVTENKKNYNFEILAGSLFYIFSPIIINNHFLNPLIPIWLIGLIPAVSYYFLKFLKTGKHVNILEAVIFTTIFSFGLHNSPWVLGFVIPVLSSLILCSILFKKTDILNFVKKSAIFFLVLAISQSFWLFGILITLFSSPTNSISQTVLSESSINNFIQTVQVTSTGTIIYPLLNLFHRQIAFDFGWNLKNIYSTFYDKTYFLNTVYIILLFLGILNFKKYTAQLERKIFIILLLAFTLSLYFFTVNIGPLKDLFLLLGNVPGFIIFRNAFDKFALGYALIYSLLITFCLVIVGRKYNSIGKIYLFLFLTFLIVTALNALSIRKVIVSPLWTTTNIYKNIIIPKEYLNFMPGVKKTVLSTNNILSIPYGNSSYTVIKDEKTNNVYAGVSPVIMFSGINDISGNLSFNSTEDTGVIDKLIIDKNYKELNNVLYKYNINYAILTKNIPEEVKKSFIFKYDVLLAQDNKFVSGITSKKIFASPNGNYELYATKKRNSLISSNNLTFKKISKVKYELSIKKIKGKQELLFNDSYHEGWNLYPQLAKDKFVCKNPLKINGLNTIECFPEHKYFEISDLVYIWKSPVFENSHGVVNKFSNKWIIDPVFIKENFDKSEYRINKDGSIDLELVLYFKPQVYFYVGVVISFSVFAFLIANIVLRKK